MNAATIDATVDAALKEYDRTIPTAFDMVGTHFGTMREILVRHLREAVATSGIVSVDITQDVVGRLAELSVKCDALEAERGKLRTVLLALSRCLREDGTEEDDRRLEALLGLSVVGDVDDVATMLRALAEPVG